MQRLRRRLAVLTVFVVLLAGCEQKPSPESPSRTFDVYSGDYATEAQLAVDFLNRESGIRDCFNVIDAAWSYDDEEKMPPRGVVSVDPGDCWESSDRRLGACVSWSGEAAKVTIPDDAFSPLLPILIAHDIMHMVTDSREHADDGVLASPPTGWSLTDRETRALRSLCSGS